MSGTGAVALFAALFVATHLLMSHPLREPLARRLGPRGFQAAYSAVSFATFIPMVLAAATRVRSPGCGSLASSCGGSPRC